MEILDTFMSSAKNDLNIFSTTVNQHFTYLEHVTYSLSTMYKSFPLFCFEIYTVLQFTTSLTGVEPPAHWCCFILEGVNWGEHDLNLQKLGGDATYIAEDLNRNISRMLNKSCSFHTIV